MAREMNVEFVNEQGEELNNSTGPWALRMAKEEFL
jgi:hypothetical protein